MPTPSVYDIARAWSEGFAAALKTEPRNEQMGPHWLAGWDAGYGLKPTKHELLNVYMESIGHKPFGVVKLANVLEGRKMDLRAE